MCSAITYPTGLKTTNMLVTEQGASVADSEDVFGKLFNIMSSLGIEQGNLNGMMDASELDKAKIQLASKLNAGNISEVESMLSVLTANTTNGRLNTSDPFNGKFSSFDQIAGKLLQNDAKPNLTHEVSEDITAQNEISEIKDVLSQLLALIGSQNLSKTVSNTSENIVVENSKIPYFEGLSNGLELSDITAIMRQKPDFLGRNASEEVKIDLALLADVNKQAIDPSQLIKIYSGGENSEVIELLNIEIIDENTLKVSQKTFSGIEDLIKGHHVKDMFVDASVPVKVQNSPAATIILSIGQGPSKSMLPDAVALQFQATNDQMANSANLITAVDDADNVIVTFKSDETIKVTRHSGELVSNNAYLDRAETEQVAEIKELVLPIAQKVKNIIEYRTSIQNLIGELEKFKSRT